MKRPHLTLFWNKRKNKKINYSKTPFLKTSGLSISFHKNLFDGKELITDKKIIYIFGVVFKNNKIDYDHYLRAIDELDLTKINNCKNFFKEINGQFLFIIFDRINAKLFIINDRFNSIPIFYSNFENNFKISHLYFDIFKDNRINKKFKINQKNIIEFLWFRRTFGDSTYDNMSKYLLPATILSVDSFSLKTNIYWKPNFNRKKLNAKVASVKLMNLIKSSSSRLTSDNKKNSIFLSAGHDSRIVLASMKKKPKCFSIGFTKNLEVNLAKKISINQKSKFEFIKIDKDHFVKNLNFITKISGGQYSFYDGLFAGINNKNLKKSEVFFHGHGLDYLFAGLYSPFKNYKIFNSPIFFEYINLKEKKDFNKFFINNVKFRTKGINLENFLKKSNKIYIQKYFNNKINKILSNKSNKKDTNLEKWDHLIIETLGKHYSRLNLLTMQTYAPQRTVVFDNDIFNFYLSIHPYNYKNLRLLVGVINSFNNTIGKIPTTNYGFPAGDNAMTKTIKLIIRKITRFITGNISYKAPIAKEKTFPNREHYLQNNSKLKNEINKIFENNELKNILNYIDWNLLESKKNIWLKEYSYKEEPAQFLFNLLSIHKLFELTKK